jgi:hypothetical protein
MYRPFANEFAPTVEAESGLMFRRETGPRGNLRNTKNPVAF